MTVHAERFLITGLVQGVGFRAFVVREAGRLELAGWVRNRGFDQVEAALQGEAEALDVFAVLAQRGPALAEVEHLEREPAGPDLLSLSAGARGCVALASV
ncbi:MAG TPA: acylphosphatase [Methylocystis sp.]|nr:acylphosphatase [Methylocystis sp.]